LVSAGDPGGGDVRALVSGRAQGRERAAGRVEVCAFAAPPLVQFSVVAGSARGSLNVAGSGLP